MSKLLLSLLIATVAIAPGSAQQPQAPSKDQAPDTIVVQGVRDSREEIGRFVDALTDMPALGQLSRFDWAVCPAAVGLGPDRTAAIARRMLQVAKAAEIPVAKPGCKPNVLLFLTPDKSELIGALHRKHPSYFKGLEGGDVKRMMRDPSPAAAWHVEGLLDADGIEVTRDLDGIAIVERPVAGSLLSTATRPHFIASIVVVDLDSLAGMTPTQLADYAAMRAFARTDPRRLDKSNAPTILAALEAPSGSSVPLSVTEWDLAFLKSLYSSGTNRRAGLQREEMKRILGRTIRAEREKDE